MNYINIINILWDQFSQIRKTSISHQKLRIDQQITLIILIIPKFKVCLLYNSNYFLDGDKFDGRKQKMDESIKKTGGSTNTSISASSEATLLKLIKKHNKDSEDKELIDNCLQKHFFLRILDKCAR